MRTRPVLLLFLGSVAINLAMAWAFSRMQILSGEETSVSIRDPLFLELRTQFDPICTNIAAHVFYWIGQRLAPEPSLFFGRFEKAIAMALVPVFVALYLSRREASRRTALLSAALLAIMPGFFLFASLATEYGLECVTGTAALWLATSERAERRWLSAPLASWTALTYGAGVAFVPAILWQLLARAPRRREALLWLAGFAAPWLLPFVIWTNHPTLLTGGGTLSTLPTLVHHIGQLAWEAGVHGGSYYYFSAFPALSQPVLALAASAALCVLALRREHAAVLLGWLAAVGVYVLSGREVGMRRGVPIVVFSIMALGLAWPALRDALRRLRPAALAACCYVICTVQLAATIQRFATGETRMPIDFDFRVLPGQTMARTYDYLLAHPEAVDAGYEPERTWAALRMLARRAPPSAAFSYDAIARRVQR